MTDESSWRDGARQSGEAFQMRLARFSTKGFDRGRPKSVEILWYLAKLAFIQSALPWPMPFKSAVLRMFGADVGARLYLRPGVNIHFPWRLTIGDDVWIGDRSTILNLAPVTLEHDVALAHEVYIAAAGHDISSPTFEYANRAVVVRSGAWVATRAYVGPGVTVGGHAVIAAGAVVTRDVQDWAVVGGVPARVIATRQIDGESS